MQRSFVLLFVLVFAVVFSDCATTGMSSHVGSAAVLLAQDAGFATTEPAATKVGKACAVNYLGVFATGNCSIDAAKKAGKIVKVSSVDYDYQNYLFLYGKVCTIVRGN